MWSLIIPWIIGLWSAWIAREIMVKYQWWHWSQRHWIMTSNKLERWGINTNRETSPRRSHGEWRKNRWCIAIVTTVFTWYRLSLPDRSYGILLAPLKRTTQTDIPFSIFNTGCLECWRSSTHEETLKADWIATPSNYQVYFSIRYRKMLAHYHPTSSCSWTGVNGVISTHHLTN